MKQDKIEILVGDVGHIDFNQPIKMSQEQFHKFSNFLKSIFAIVKQDNTLHLRDERLGDKLFQMPWVNEEEYEMLLHVEDTNKISELLGRSWMSIDIKRGQFLPDFMSWAKERKLDIVKDNSKEMIKEFMKTKQDEIKSRQNKRKNLNKLCKEYDSLLEREKGIELLSLLKNSDKLKKEFYNRKKELENQIKNLKNE
jgi:hypothetical protein